MEVSVLKKFVLTGAPGPHWIYRSNMEDFNVKLIPFT